MKFDSSHFTSDHNLASIEKIRSKGTDIEFFITPRYRHHYLSEEYEQFSIELLRNYLKPNSTFVDIGAHYGYYSLVANKFGKNISIIAVEPVGINHEILKRNLMHNKANIIGLHELAISDKKGEIEFNITDASDSSGVNEHPLTHTRTKSLIKTLTVDLLLQNTENVDFVKIDVEGHELNVFDGMSETLQKFRPRLIVEFNPKCQHVANHDPIDLLTKIQSIDYSIFFINEKTRELYKYDEKITSWTELIGEQSYVNLLCIPQEKSRYVLYLAHSPFMGGAERSLSELILGLRDYGALGHVIVPNPRDGFGQAIINNGIGVTECDLAWVAGVEAEMEERRIEKSLEDVFKLCELVEKLNPDLIFTNTGVIPWGAILAECVDKPHVWKLNEFIEKDHKLKLVFPFPLWADYIGRSSEVVIANSKAVAQEFNRFMIDKKCEVCYYNIKVPMIKERKELLFSDSRPLKIVVAGRVHEGKRQKDAVIAVQKLIDENKEIELMLIGSYDEKDPYVKEIIEIINGYPQIKLLGFKKDGIFTLSQSDIIVLPSECEAFGRVTMEAMLLGKPVIGTNTGGTPELIKDGETGFLYSPGNVDELAEKIDFFYSNRQILKEFGINAKKHAEELNNNTYFDEMLSYFKLAVVMHKKKLSFLLIALKELLKIEESQNGEYKITAIKKQLTSERDVTLALINQLNDIKRSKMFRLWQKYCHVKRLIKLHIYSLKKRFEFN